VNNHKLPDLLAPNLRVVFVGTAAGRHSAEVGAYYAGRGNRFWPTLREIGLTPRLFEPREFRDLLALGIGLTDMSKLRAGMDHWHSQAAPLSSSGLSRGSISPRAPGQVDGWMVGTSPTMTTVVNRAGEARPARHRLHRQEGREHLVRVSSTRGIALGRQAKRNAGFPEIFVLPSPGAARCYWSIADAHACFCATIKAGNTAAVFESEPSASGSHRNTP